MLEALREIFSGDGFMPHGHCGVGLGLSLVRGLVEALGGELSLESEVGRSTFRLLLPEVPAVVPDRSPGAAAGA